MSEHEGDGVTYVLFLALAAVLVVGWLFWKITRSAVRPVNAITSL